jgi:hypothetical protein
VSSYCVRDHRVIAIQCDDYYQGIGKHTIILKSTEYSTNRFVHSNIVDRANLAYVQVHLRDHFPDLLSDIDIMTRAIRRDYNLFVICTVKDNPSILITAMNRQTAYPLLRTKTMDYVLNHVPDVLMHVVRVSNSYEELMAYIPPFVWTNNTALQREWMKRKGPLLPCTIARLNEYTNDDENHPRNRDIRDLALFIAQYNSNQFHHVPEQFRHDVTFMKVALEISAGRVLKLQTATNLRSHTASVTCS